MSGFDEVLFPLTIALGSSGGPERRTDIVTLGSGRELRQTPWAASRRRYDVGGAVRTASEAYVLLAFFEARQGRLHGFRFRDPLDWRSGPPQTEPSALDQTLGVGDGAGTMFNLLKRYDAGALTPARRIRKPAAGSVRIALNGVELGSGAFTVDAASGAVTLAAPPASGVTVTAGFAFDTPVRFDLDRLDFAIEGAGAVRPVSVPLVEIL